MLRERTIVAGAVLLLTAGAWWYTLTMAASMREAMVMPQDHLWSALDAAAVCLMWAIMMVAMMTPSATPMLLTFSSVHRRRRERQRPYVPVFLFLAGYLIVWIFFSVLASALQWALQATVVLSPHLKSVNPFFSGTILISAGIYQLTPWKQSCLLHCRDPLGFIMTAWRDGYAGAVQMGIHHGLYCLGCCWLLMVLLFVVGVMNILWIALLAVFVLVEKLLGPQRPVSLLCSAILTLWGSIVILQAIYG